MSVQECSKEIWKTFLAFRDHDIPVGHSWQLARMLVERGCHDAATQWPALVKDVVETYREWLSYASMNPEAEEHESNDVYGNVVIIGDKHSEVTLMEMMYYAIDSFVKENNSPTEG